MQLEFFPRTELRALADFQRLSQIAPSQEERRSLIQDVSFFQSPKGHDAITSKHSAYIDEILGFRLNYIEEMLVAEARGFDPDGNHETLGPLLHDGAQSWVGLDLETLQTPYSEILSMLRLLKAKPFQQVVDLGAAYGRMGVVIGGLFIKSSFTGYEIVKARVDEGNRVFQELDLKRSRLVSQDLSDPSFELPAADVYFLYDYGQVEHIERTLKQIEVMAHHRPVKVVVRGKATNEVIKAKHGWLDPRYEGPFSIYTAYIV